MARPMTTIQGAVGCVATIMKLCAIAAPVSMPRTKMAASASPSPERKTCRPGQPPARVNDSPARSMPAKFSQWTLWAAG